MTVNDALERAFESGPAGPPQLPRPSVPRSLKVEHQGLGYRAVAVLDGVVFEVARLVEHRDGLSCELTVRGTGDGPAGLTADRHLYRTRFNLLSGSTRKITAHELAARSPGQQIPFDALLELLCLQVVAEYRRGEPVEAVGGAPDEPEEYLIEPVIPMHELTWIYGPMGSMKSTAVTALALAIETGRPVIPGWQPRHRERVLWLEYEQRNPGTHNRRIRRILAGAAIPPTTLDRKWCTRPLAELVEEVATLRDEAGYGCFVVDSAGPATGGAREGYSFNDRALDLIRAMRTIGGTWLVIDQVTGEDARGNKPSHKAMDGVQKMYGARAAYWIGRERGTVGPTVEVSIHQTKLSEGKPMRPLGLAITHEADVITFARKDIEAPDLVAGLPATERITRFLKANGAATAPVIARELEIPPSSVRTYLNRDLKGKVIKVDKERWGMAL